MAHNLKQIEKNVYTAFKCDFGNGSVKAVVSFSESPIVSILKIEADGQAIGVGALANWQSTDIAEIEINPTSGVHDVKLTIDGNAVLLSLDFSAEPIYAGISYTPTPEKKFRDTMSDTWEATDMLGRKVLSVEDVGAKNDRKVGIFYWTWHEANTVLRPVNVTKLLAEYPAAEYNENHPGWGEKPFQPFWNEPLYGFYKDSDPYVIRHHMSLLANAGVDFLLFDCTNDALLWRVAYEPLLAEMHRMREDGVKTPQIAFMMNFAPDHNTEKMLRAVYQNLYKPGLYSDLWFRIDGKPMVMAYMESLPEHGACETDELILNEIKSFFAFRPGQPNYGRGPRRPDQWGWLEKYPQHKYGERPDGSCEMMTVGVAQNANDERICTCFNDKDTYGRSYTGKFGHALLTKDSYKYGYNVQEQWDRVIDIGPDYAFITGWNEWIMGVWHQPWIKDENSTQLAMVDQYDREHSRDIEMDKDGYLDTYYLQMVSNIRRFKGATQRAKVSEPKTIRIRAGERQWKDVSPLYVNDKGTTVHRDWDGFKGCHYVNETGRNDIISAKVARDAENLYFMVNCAEAITAPSAEGWMTLFIDADRSKKTGWEGYDFAINLKAPVKGKTEISKYAPTAVANSFTWEKIGSAAVSVKGSLLQIAVPRELLGMSGKLDFEFKWSDNLCEKNAMDFYQNGDTAPIGRFNYLYKE